MTKGLIIFALKSLSELLHPQKIGKIADEELGSNHVDSETDETISKSELLDEETNLFSNKKKKQKEQKRTEICMEGQYNRGLGRLYLFQ